MDSSLRFRYSFGSSLTGVCSIQFLLHFLSFPAIVTIVQLTERLWYSVYLRWCYVSPCIRRSKNGPNGRITVVEYMCRSKIGELHYSLKRWRKNWRIWHNHYTRNWPFPGLMYTEHPHTHIHTPTPTHTPIHHTYTPMRTHTQHAHAHTQCCIQLAEGKLTSDQLTAGVLTLFSVQQPWHQDWSSL